jgi:hypothetical protein
MSPVTGRKILIAPHAGLGEDLDDRRGTSEALRMAAWFKRWMEWQF